MLGPYENYAKCYDVREKLGVTVDNPWCAQSRSRSVGDGIVIRVYVHLGRIAGGVGWMEWRTVDVVNRQWFSFFVAVCCPVVL
jgi:hypothetical protein